MSTPLQAQNEAFRLQMEALNPAQRQAVEQTEGPVLVIAGPGTGKTHVLATRIGKILLDTDARPQNILCLTFTDAGVNAMRERLLGMIGPEAHRVPIFTFHAFCNRVIQENLELFGRSDMEPLTDLERIEIVRRLLEKLAPEHPLRADKKNVFHFERQLRDLFATMKKEGWQPGLVLKKADEYLAGLPENPDFLYQKSNKYGKKGEPKASKVKEAQEKMERLKAAADLYPKYINALERAGRYEYEDMILWVTRAFEKHENLLRGYQERYQYFLVDEYQDTNGAQNRILNQLLNFWPNPNVFIVGDDDQSIYEFQGARLANLLEFYHQHKGQLQTIVLETNYRSTQEILDAARLVIERNELRAIQALDGELSKDLRAYTNTHAAPIIKVYENRLHETVDIAAQIEKLLQSGVAPKQIAVIYARHKQAMLLMQLLDKKGIAYETKRPVNLLDLPLIRQLRELLHYLHDETGEPFSGDHRLFRLLHANWWQLDTLDLAKVGAQRAAADKPAPWRTLMRDADFLENLHIGDKPKLLAAFQQLEQWISDAVNLPMTMLLERLYTQSGMLHWALEQPDKIWWLQVLNTLMEFVKAESGRNARFSMERLLQLFNSMDDNQLALNLQQSVRASNGVQLVTAHSAKGLEFEHVFLIDCTADFWEPSARGGNSRFVFPDTLTQSGEEDALEARRRLFYVAITRAKRHLQISYSLTDTNGKALQQAGFVDETGLPKTKVNLPTEALLESQALLLLESPKPVITLPEDAVLAQLIDNYDLSITALNRYLRCPLAFYYQDVLRIPENMSEAAAFGQAMHEALRQYFLKMKADPKQEFPGAETLQRLFSQEMERQRGYFSINAYAQRSALGKNYLNRYALEQVPYWRRRAVVERRIDRMEFEGIPLTGVLDKIEWIDQNKIRVVDYKTGIPDPKKVAPPSEDVPLGGDYWRQLAFYKILLDRARIYPEQVESGAIAWLEPDKKGNFVVTEHKFSADEIRFMEQLIRDTYLKIKELKFTEGCGEPDCVWCNMHKDRVVAGMLPNMEEGLDD
jgi:DNA helicase-2/ATP-dependent DNA helicase PcrA